MDRKNQLQSNQIVLIRKKNLRSMNGIETDIPRCKGALSVPHITAVHTGNAEICWSTRGHVCFAGDDEKFTAGALLDMLIFCLDCGKGMALLRGGNHQKLVVAGGSGALEIAL